MRENFNTLEVLARRDVGYTPTLLLVARLAQYQDAALDELLDRLEEATESYLAIAPHLPPNLRKSAREEIEFFAVLFRQRLAEVMHNLNTDQSQKVFRLLSA